jgi:TPR repeat protein
LKLPIISETLRIGCDRFQDQAGGPDTFVERRVSQGTVAARNFLLESGQSLISEEIYRSFSMEDELQRLRSEASRLERAIQEIRTETGNGPNNDGVTTAAARRDRCRELRRELEVVWHQQAELEETERVKQLVQKAVDTNMVETPMMLRNIGECPLCLKDTHEVTMDQDNASGRFWCCGATCCRECFGKIAMKVNPKASKKEQRKLLQSLEKKHPCPFCRGRFRPLQGIYSPRLLLHAEAGKSWAQYEIGNCYVTGNGVTRDEKQGIEWLKLSADQGYTMAMAIYGLFLQQGAPESGLAPLDEEAHPYALAAARQGSSQGQYICSLYAHTYKMPEESSMWSALAASQTDPMAFTMVAADCYYGRNGVRRSCFAAIYWLRKAAGYGLPEACASLPALLLEAKTKLFGAPDIVGFSAIPEAVLWADAAVGRMCRPLGEVSFQVRYRYKKPDAKCFDLSLCGSCGKQAPRNATFHVCAKCKSIAYCGKTCQQLHWKLGHKIDCTGAEKFRAIWSTFSEHMLKVKSSMTQL